MSEAKIPAHSHCRICSKAIPWKKEFCSNECKESSLKNERKAKRTSRIFLGGMIALLVVLMLSQLALAR